MIQTENYCQNQMRESFQYFSKLRTRIEDGFRCQSKKRIWLVNKIIISVIAGWVTRINAKEYDSLYNQNRKSMNSTNIPRGREETIIQKVVRLQYDSSPQQQMVKVNLQYLTNTREINFSKAMKDIATYGFPIDNSQIFYWDYSRKMFIFIGNYPFKQDCLLKYEHFQEKVIHLRIRRIGKTPEFIRHEREQMASSAMEIESRGKTEKRVKERSIQEVIDKVRQWRYLYERVDGNGKKIHTLDSAAREVGIAKKTLDDYYLHLRLAEKHRFDFQANRNAKIGVLRTFVKENQKNIKMEPEAESVFDHQISNPPAPSVKEQNQTIHHHDMLSSSDDQSQPYLFHHQDSCDFNG